MSNYTDDYAMAESLLEQPVSTGGPDKSAAKIAFEQIGNDEVENLLKSTMEIYEDIAQKGADSVFIQKGNTFWLTDLPPEILDTAKHILSTYAPEAVQKLERSLPQLERKCPDIRILRQTTPYSQMKFIPHLPPRITKPKIQQVAETPPKPSFGNTTNPIKRQELSVGTIYSMAANGARKEEQIKTNNIPKMQTNPFHSEYNDNTMFSYNNLYSNIAQI